MGNICRCLLQVLGKSNVIEIKNVQFSVDFPRMHMGRDIWMLSVKYFKYVPLLHFFEVILHAGGFLAWLGSSYLIRCKIVSGQYTSKDR